MAFLIFLLTYLLISNNHVVAALIERILSDSISQTKSADKKILELLLHKAHLKLPYFWISDTDKYYGMMAGIPFKPIMFLSSFAYKNLGKDELEWVILHEAGHYKFYHTPKELIQQLIFIIVGILILNDTPSLILALALAIIFGLLTIQIGRLHEIQANRFALKRMANPQGAIDSSNRSLKKWPQGGIFRQLFKRWDPTQYYKQIKDAEKEIQRRKPKS